MSANAKTVTMSIEQLVELVTNLQVKVTELEAKIEPKRNEAQREMTDADAVRILSGDLADTKHKDAAAQLGLSYGQVYSCRLEFTFKHIHKALR